MLTSIDTSLLLSSAHSTSKNTSSGSNTLDDKDAFLKILIAQLENQDPTNPMDDTEFVSQMAQFSTLEQMTNLASYMENLIEAEQQTYIGKEVSWSKTVTADDGTTSTSSGTGTITGVTFGDDHSVTFTLNDGTEISSSNIKKIIGGTSTESALIQASYLIGKEVTYKNDAGEEETAAVSAVSIQNGTAVFTLDNGEKITIAQFSKIAN
ncbi:flagellar hook capping FlgD N-terminal domain-containing protein [Weizmannia acidilactici]|uniref:flagellar hook capping FlgD N-terminal domain-containing protein n=1 Tax=Weizmannia acidilactici TaxID=2607726 RepID=UPI0020A44937|nr:flagellar hook capping FlgD N-terminal domain-containing protein [Weizmannia acidilactici]